MRLRLKEEPREWQRFTAVLMLLVLILGGLSWRRGLISLPGFAVLAGLAVAVVLAALICPKPFRPVYRAGMRVSFHVGQVMGWVLLTVTFILLVTPLGWLLRICGKDLLGLKREPDRSSYWHRAKTNRQFDRLF